MRKIINNKTTKIAILVSIWFSVKLVISCTPTASLNMQYNAMRIEAVNNSGAYLQSLPIDTMHANAVALKLTLSDSTFHRNFALHNSTFPSLGFSQAMATTINESFKPTNQIEKITVITMFDINEQIKAGDDITAHIVYCTGNSFQLYMNENDAIASLNNYQSYPLGVIYLILKSKIHLTIAQFKVVITFTDQTDLSSISETFTIIQA
jgi:hypothetical protein